MQNFEDFEDIEELVAHMFEKLDGDEPVSVVADKDLAVNIMSELLTYDNVILNFAKVDTYDYDINSYTFSHIIFLHF